MLFRSTNHLGHFLLVNLLLEDLKQSPKNNPAGAPRCIIVGSITGNTNTLAGNVPPKVRRRARWGLVVASCHFELSLAREQDRQTSPWHPSSRTPAPQADLGDLRGLSAGLDGRAASMIDGGEFDGAKAYKDSKVGRGLLGSAAGPHATPKTCAPT